MKDIELYYTVIGQYDIGFVDGGTEIGQLYNEIMPSIKGFISERWWTYSKIRNCISVITVLMSKVSDVHRNEARLMFIKKNGERGGLWKDIGVVGSLVEIHAKLSRLIFNPEDDDSIVDLFNYCVITLMCIKIGRIKILDDAHTAIVTGDSQGLGRGIAEILDLNGIRCFPYGARKSRGEIKDFFDLLEWQGIKHIDYLINNYGINHLNWIGNIDDDDFEILDVNVKLPMMVVDELVKRRFGPSRILNISSQTYRIAQRCTMVYCASKAAVVQMTKVMARELAGEGYIVNALAPGKILGTEMTRLTDKQVLTLRGWDEESADAYAKSMIPMGRFSTIEEMSLIAVNILDLPPYINGSVIEAMGGV